MEIHIKDQYFDYFYTYRLLTVKLQLQVQNYVCFLKIRIMMVHLCSLIEMCAKYGSKIRIFHVIFQNEMLKLLTGVFLGGC